MQVQVCPVFIKKSAKLSVFICENRKNPLIYPQPFGYGPTHRESYSSENIYKIRVVSKVQLCIQMFLMQKSYAIGTCSFSLKPRFHAKKVL